MVIIKATRLQAWALTGGARVGRRLPPPSKIKKYFWAILGAFWLFFLHMGAFLLRFSHFGGLFATFYFMVEAFFGLAPPPTKISAGTHDCKEGSRACSREFSELWTCFVTILP